MTWRKVLLYWVVAALIGATVYVGERRDEVAPPPSDAVQPLVTVSPSRFERVTVTRGGETATFVRESDRWVVVTPAGYRITSDLVAALIDTLASIPPVEKLSTSARTSEQFGLAPPEAEIAMDGPGGADAEVYVGKRNPTGTAVYAALAGEDSVYLLGLNAQYYLELIFEELGRQRAQARAVE
jgi:hypothetical protein